ncbi:hypothetical protein LRP67_19925 [Nocardioides sp. cx-169]|uniref:hypothetical protein n=1 Tax=Nocardioides sp. cx-169 TaxID=2899080 RepID=UPI001E3D6818|nr:hypothetical protein [Nocardioides sp. cx-169]MCD4536367.1 hypothetical protein [Nocardioides sp. cx-169]
MPDLATPTLATPEAGTATTAPARDHRPSPLPTLTVPAGGEGRLDLDAEVGGLRARYAEWRGGSGRLVATGEGAWSDTTAVFAIDAGGRAVAPVSLTTGVRVVGLPVATVRSTVADWDGSAPVPLPRVVRTEGSLRVSGGAVEVARGLTATAAEEVTTITLPPSLAALAAADPVATGVRDLLGALLGADVSRLSLRAGDTGAAPAVVAGDVGLVPEGVLPPTSPDAARVLDALVRAWLAHREGPVEVDVARPDPTPREVVAEVPPAAAPAVEAAEGAVGAAAPETAGAPPAVSPPEAGGEAAAPAVDGSVPPTSGEGETPAPVELLMPPAPAEPGPAQTARIGAVGGAARTAAGRAATLPPADATVAAARGAVSEPAAETAARAGADLAAALGERPPPSPEIVALAERIRRAIREKRPVDEDELTKANIEGAAQEAGQTLNTAVTGDAQRVQGSYAPLAATPTGTPASTATPVTPPPAGVADPGIAGPRAAPDPIPDQSLSLDADHSRVETMATDARIERHSTEPLQGTPPYSAVAADRAELAGVAATGPPDVAAQQAAAIATAQADMASLQQQALAALTSSRGGTVAGVSASQGGMVGQETVTRESVSRQAQAIFTDAQGQVGRLLEPLSRTALARWDAEVARLSREFKDHLARVQRWIDERHSGASGFFVGIYDAVAGLPGWVVREYDDAERRFGDGVCEVLLSISSDVNGVVAAAEAVIDSARTRTHDLFATLPDDLRAWAEGEEARFARQLDGLAAQAQEARTSFVTDISQRAVTAVAEVQHEVEALREKAGGLVGRIVAAIEAFIDDPVRAIINGLLTLVGIPPASFWALVEKIGQVIDQIADDPETFANNLVAALRLGFEGFFERFGSHLLTAFWSWLFSKLGNVGVTLPRDSSVGSIITFILQVMGITWPRIREILVRHVGAQNVAIIEKVWELVSLLIERGPDGVLEMLREKLEPEAIVNAVLEAAVEFVIQALVERVALRLLAMLNPAGAVLQAIELIYRVLRWVFENAARIFALVETVVNAAAEILAGNLTGVATMVENALARLLPLVIDLLAGMLGLGDLPEQVAAVIGRLQAVVLPVVERVIVALVTRGRALLAALGVGGGAGEGGEDHELGESVRFSAGGESHRLWVDPAGARLMVASSPTPLQQKVAEWRAEVTAMPDDRREKPTAAALLSELEPLIVTGNQQAADLKQAGAAAEHDSDPATQPPSDDALEANEQRIATLLNRLITILVPDVEQIIATIVPVLPGHATAKVAELKQDWAGPLENLEVGPVNERQKLLQNVATGAFGTLDAGAGAGALSSSSNLRALAAYFVVARRDRSPQTETFRAYVFTERRPDPPHRVRVAFIEAVGTEAARMLADVVRTELDAGRLKLSEDEKTKIRDSLGRVAFQIGPTSDHGNFRGLGNREPDHAWFKPKPGGIRPADGTGNLEYTTESDQRFTIETADKLPRQVVGRNLTLYSGRGITQDSPYFIPGQGFNRAHVIANRFGGTGFADWGNLVTTSAHYNHPVMSGAESRIVQHLNDTTGNGERRVPGTPAPAAAPVTFTLQVNLDYVAVTEPLAASTIAGDSDLPDKDPGIREAILARIREAGLIDKLKRVKDTRYDVRDIAPALPGKSPSLTLTPLGEDRWLLSGE